MPVTGPEAKLARAQRFGLPLSGDALKAKRAERLEIFENFNDETI